jgi:hypothetical protein
MCLKNNSFWYNTKLHSYVAKEGFSILGKKEAVDTVTDINASILK